jgi:hypothetical protein
MKLKSDWHVWKNTVSCGICNSSWHSSDPDVSEAWKTDECPQCKRNQELIELADNTAKLLRKNGASPKLVLERYVKAYLANRKQKLVRS